MFGGVCNKYKINIESIGYNRILFKFVTTGVIDIFLDVIVPIDGINSFYMFLN